MLSPATPAVGRVQGAPHPRTWQAALAMGLAAGLGTSDASAAGIGTLASSTGLLATMLAVFAMKGWPVLSTASTVGGAVIVAIAIAWLLPIRPGGFRRVSKARPAGSTRRTSLPVSAGAASCSEAILRSRGIEAEALRAELIELFLRVQSAWDRAELAALRDGTTPEMLHELMTERTHRLEEAPRTRIVTVEADLCAHEEMAGGELLTVAYSGSLQEGASSPTVPFREVWLLTRSRALDDGWKLAKHQTLF